MKANCILVDLDGTLTVYRQHRTRELKGAYLNDAVNEPVKQLLELSSEPPRVKIVILTGRSSVYRQETRKWLRLNDIAYDLLVMRPPGNTEPEEVIKLKLYAKHVEPLFNTLFVLEDKSVMCVAYRDIGLCVFQVRANEVVSEELYI